MREAELLRAAFDAPERPLAADGVAAGAGGRACLREELGRGSFGTVRVATWGAPGRGRVAVEVIHRHRINSVQMDSFMRALQLELSLAPHPNICRLHGWACDATSAVLAVDGLAAAARSRRS